MGQRNINKVLETTNILSRAGGLVIKSSFNTAKQIAMLYKEAGVKAFSLSKEVVQKTVELTWSNQKEIIKTSGNAIKKAAQNIREEEEIELKTMTKARAKKVGKKKRQSTVKKDITIDDLLD